MDVSLEDLNFDTERLRVGEWHRVADRAVLDLASVVVELMTARTTRALPDAWRGDYSVERARHWIVERDAESPTLLVVDRQTGAAIGLLFLFFDTSADTDVSADAKLAGGDVRIGYLLSDAMWGQGIGSELVAGLVGWCRGQSGIATVTAGVEASNVASVRILVKNGFALVRGSEDEERDDALTYRISVAGSVDSELRGE